ncbi:MAG: hypothetical protein Q8909_18885, partial [Bacteroidota bacterium]|nr:hypothetical protein [Bacteroidota bacterium]
IILIAWLQLLLLLFPTAVKFIHRHTQADVCQQEKQTGYVITGGKHASDCPICNFEFVQFVQPEEGILPEQPVYPDKRSAFHLSAVTVEAVALPSLRAPPAC